MRLPQVPPQKRGTQGVVCWVRLALRIASGQAPPSLQTGTGLERQEATPAATLPMPNNRNAVIKTTHFFLCQTMEVTPASCSNHQSSNNLISHPSIGFQIPTHRVKPEKTPPPDLGRGQAPAPPPARDKHLMSKQKNAFPGVSCQKRRFMKY